MQNGLIFIHALRINPRERDFIINIGHERGICNLYGRIEHCAAAQEIAYSFTDCVRTYIQYHHQK